MKKIIFTLLVLLSIVTVAPSCSKDNQTGTDNVKELNTDAVVYWLIEIDRYLELKDDINSGYPAESFAMLESVKSEIETLLSETKDGTTYSQETIDALAEKAATAVKDFKDSYRYVARTAELYVPGADDTSNYIKLGEPGAFDSYSTISVSFWFKGAEKLNIQRQGSIISNFYAPGNNKFFGWEINTWADNDQGGGPYKIRISRGFSEGLNELQPQFNEYMTWHHIAYTYDNVSHHSVLWFDGQSISEGTTSSDPLSPEFGVQMCAFKNLTDPNNPKAVSGSIKNLRFWDKSLTAEEITADMTAEVSGDEPGLIAAWDFTRTVENPENVMDKTGRHRAQILGNKIEWRTIE